MTATPPRASIIAMLLLVGSLALIGAVTLSPMPGIPRHEFRWGLFRSPIHAMEGVLNTLLFVPLGLAAWRLRCSGWQAAVLGVGVSLTVELLQLFVIDGRYGELQDLLANTLGTWLGWAAATRVASRPRASR